MQDIRSVAKAGLLMATMAALCRFLSLGKELYVASVFGAGRFIDAYSLAILVPALGMTLFVNGIRRSFLTQYPQHQADPTSNAETFANLFLSSSLLAAIGLAVVLSFGLQSLWPLLISKQNPEIVAELMRLTLPAAWLIVPMTAVSGLTAILQVRHQFSRPQLTHVIPTLCIVGFVASWGREWGAVPLIWGLLAGTCLQSGVLLWMVIRADHRPQPRFDLHTPNCIALWRFGVAIIVLELLSQCNVFVDRSMAGQLDAPGKISVLYWGAMLKDFFAGTLVASFSWVLLPHFSRQVVQGETQELRHSCSLVLRYGAIAIFPLSALLILCGPPLLAHVELGRLDRQTAGAFAQCLAAYGLGLFAELSSVSLIHALMALGRMRQLVVVGLLGSFLPNIVFNVLLIGPWGEVGLALSTALVAYSTLIGLYAILRQTIGFHEEIENLKVVGGSFLASAAMLLTGEGVLEFLRNSLSRGTANDFVAAIVAGVAGLAVYGALMLLFPGSKDAQNVAQSLREKLTAILWRAR